MENIYGKDVMDNTQQNLLFLLQKWNDENDLNG